MACYSPLHAFKGVENERGKRPLIWRAPAGSERQDVPCGKCIGCRLVYAKGWAVRCVHEAQTHVDNCFVTLTFDEKSVPADGNLDVRHIQLFMKRARKKLGPFRYFFAGEYGGKGRPHYHGLLFGMDFKDKVLQSERMGNMLYASKTLGQLWPYGFHSIGDVNFKSASYVARYCVKKATNVATSETFKDVDLRKRILVDKATGQFKIAEFTVMSRNPGIGSRWFERFRQDVYPSDEVILSGGKSVRPPRYYDYLLDKDDPDLLESLKLERSQKVDWSESTLDRLLVKEEVVLANLKHFKRTLEV